MSERIRFIDALRGISLAGIVMAHFGEQYLGFMPPPGRPYNIHGMADSVLEASSWILVRGKGFGIFSFMFGLSFALQMQRADRRAPGTDFRHAAPTLPAVIRTVHAALICGPQLSRFRAGGQGGVSGCAERRRY